MRWRLAVMLVPLLCGTAAADELLDAPQIGPAPSMVERLAEGLTALSDELGEHLSTVSGDMLDMQVDVRARTAHLRLGGGDGGRFLLRLDGNMVFERGGTRVKARLDIGLVGHHLSLALPDFDVVPRSVEGKRYLELRLPILEGRF